MHDKRRPSSPPTPPPNPALVPLRGPSGRLYGILDRGKLTIEVKRKNEPAETIDLRQYLAEPPLADA